MPFLFSISTFFSPETDLNQVYISNKLQTHGRTGAKKLLSLPPPLYLGIQKIFEILITLNLKFDCQQTAKFPILLHVLPKICPNTPPPPRLVHLCVNLLGVLQGLLNSSLDLSSKWRMRFWDRYTNHHTTFHTHF